MPRKSKAKPRTLSAGLARSADKRGLTGEARERYIIGGAIDAEKKHQAKLAHAKSAKAATKKKPVAAGPRLELVVRKNAEASASRSYDVYSLYRPNSKTPYSSATYRKRSDAEHAKKTEIEKHHNKLGVVLGQKSLV